MGGLLRNAEAAMREGNKSGPAGYVVSARGFVRFLGPNYAVRHEAAQGRRRAEVDAPLSAAHRALDRRMIGVEALIRWPEPGRHHDPARRLHPARRGAGVDRSDRRLGRETRSCYQAGAWQDLGIDLEIGFNLSPRQFWQPDLAGKILSQIGNGRVEPSRFVVEVTESSAMIDPGPRPGDPVGAARGGLRIAIDDFGTGYSSLSRLRDARSTC